LNISRASAPANSERTCQRLTACLSFCDYFNECTIFGRLRAPAISAETLGL
jgi:hypothetical protein